jgi:hypothetical protein
MILLVHNKRRWIYQVEGVFLIRITDIKNAYPPAISPWQLGKEDYGSERLTFHRFEQS